MNRLIALTRRAVNRSLIILKDYYIDFSIQKRFIGDRRINSIDPGSGVNIWQSTSYEAVEMIFFKCEHVHIRESDIIIDVGSGDGKVFNYLLYKGLENKMMGFELNTQHCLKTQNGLNKYQNVEIICGDIFNNFPYNGTVFYLFNPFDGRLMAKFIDRILKMKDVKPTIIYNRPSFVSLFDEKLFEVKMVMIHQYKFADGKYAVIRFRD